MKKTLCSLLLATSMLGCSGIKTRDNPRGYIVFNAEEREEFGERNKSVSMTVDFYRFMDYLFQEKKKAKYEEPPNKYQYTAYR